TISVGSQPGQGSRFRFAISLGLAPPRPTPAHRTPLPERLRVLVVDDNATNRAIQTAYLRSRGVRCDAVDSGPEALAALHRGVDDDAPFALAILDDRMPEMDGHELAAAIRHARRLRSTALLM